MIDQIEENTIVIVKDSTKTNFIKELRKNGKLFNIKVLGLKEFKKKYYFDYTNEAVYHVHKKYGVIKDIAKIYIENLYYIGNCENEKISLLKEIKEDLDKHNLLIEDKTFKNFLKNKKVALYNLDYIDNFYENMFKNLELSTDVTKLNHRQPENRKKKIYKFPNKESEVAFVASSIAELLKSGTDIDKIKLANVDEDYAFTIKTIFDDFKIPIELNVSESISSTVIVKQFKKYFDENIEETFEKIKPLIKSGKDEKIYKMLIDTINDYNWADNLVDVKDFIFDDIDNLSIPKKPLKNAIRVISFTDDSIGEDEYVFLLGFNQGSIPKNHKDEDFLNDDTKRKIGLSDSIDLNKKAVLNVQDKIANTKNLTVTYRVKDLNGELYISSAYKEELFDVSESIESYEHSNAYNKKLLTKEKDENRKYGTISNRLIKLNAHYKDEPYLDYDNRFKGLDKNKLKKYLDNKLTLSYSSMNSYYLCSYRYYLDNILKVDKFEDTFEIIVGNIFHKVLSLAFDENFDFEKTWNKAIEEQTFEFKIKEKFFLSILKDELKFVIETIQNQKSYTSLDKAMYEEKITIPLANREGITFKGFVDKILYNEDKKNKVVAIIDYKTGNPELNLDNSIYGIDMQLPIYAYLIKNYAPLKNAKIGGFYLQKILNNIKDPNKKRNALKLQGYSNSNSDILKVVDNSYVDSKIIKSLRQSSNGFYSYAKVLSEEEIDRLTDIVKSRIEEAADSIMEGRFDINPKQIGDKQVGCKFCKYKDICYMKNKDVSILEKKTKKDFLGGEQNANMD